MQGMVCTNIDVKNALLSRATGILKYIQEINKKELKRLSISFFDQRVQKLQHYKCRVHIQKHPSLKLREK